MGRFASTVAGFTLFLTWSCVSIVGSLVSAAAFHLGFTGALGALLLLRKRAAEPRDLALIPRALLWVPMALSTLGCLAIPPTAQVTVALLGGAAGALASARWFVALQSSSRQPGPLGSVLLSFALASVIRALPLSLTGPSPVGAAVVLTLLAAGSMALVPRGEAPGAARPSPATNARTPLPLVAQFAFLGIAVGALRADFAPSSGPSPLVAVGAQLAPAVVFLGLFAWDTARRRGTARPGAVGR